jgi:hypothetical protein
MILFMGLRWFSVLSAADFTADSRSCACQWRLQQASHVHI